MPFSPPDWSSDGYIADNNYSTVGISSTNGGVMLGTVDAASKAKESLRKKIEKRAYEILIKLLQDVASIETLERPFESEARFLGAKIASESVIYFMRDEIWFSPMGDIYQLYSIQREDLGRIAARSLRAFLQANERYANTSNEEYIDVAVNELVNGFFEIER